MSASDSTGPARRLNNPYASLISQSTTTIPSFTLESGVTLHDVPVAYKTWGKLNPRGDNCLVICHALTGSADVEDWWGPLLGVDRAFDPTRWFIFCGNVIGSPYGTISSLTTDRDGRVYGPEMSGSSVKDDVRLHYLVLRSLGVNSIAAVIGGSMGGMTTLEYPLNTPPGFVKHIVPLATSARHSAWCISWGEAQRQSIYSDPDYRDGYYYEVPSESGGVRVDLTNQPNRGLAAARMAALLTYRSRDSFESRFGRRAGGKSKVPKGGVRIMGGPETTDPSAPGEAELADPRYRAWKEHNDGHRSGGRRGSEPVSRPGSSAGVPVLAGIGAASGSGLAGSASDASSSTGEQPVPESNGSVRPGDAETEAVASGVSANGGGVRDGKSASGTGADRSGQKVFSAQSYLRYQGDKFTSRFDANCYIHITRKLDTHDLSHPSTQSDPPTISSQLPPPSDDPDELSQSLQHALSLLPPALVIGIESDGLFTTTEQKELAAHIPDAELVLIPSPDGHDGFLLEFEAINGWVEGWLRRKMPDFYTDEARLIRPEEYGKEADEFGAKKDSVFGEAEADVTRW
ncbi:homoserine O- acetyltransferase [Saitozyma podzolica]|uniref:Homoserine O-acetyltransferase n=1 Tax=Saitozyma podzolica TaxID=1890683 RepID=A0A427YCT8_9TREE|nr:homoserine O- acetyltransferase [Saitozyma podzolica]